MSCGPGLLWWLPKRRDYSPERRRGTAGLPRCRRARAWLGQLLPLPRAEGLGREGEGSRSLRQAGVPLSVTLLQGGGVAVALLWPPGSSLFGELRRLMRSRGGGLWGPECGCGRCWLSSIPAGLGSIQQHLPFLQRRVCCARQPPRCLPCPTGTPGVGMCHKPCPARSRR